MHFVMDNIVDIDMHAYFVFEHFEKQYRFLDLSKKMFHLKVFIFLFPLLLASPVVSPG